MLEIKHCEHTVLNGHHVVVEWETNNLNVWISHHDYPGINLQFSEHDIDTIKRMISCVREQKWLDYQQNNQKN